ncbi:MAG: TolC family protein, partial [Desulfobacterales bacterium]
MKRLKAFCLIQCLLLFFLKIPFVKADNNVPMDAPKMFDLPELLKEATERNPEIIAAKEKWQSAQDIIGARGALPDPQLSFQQYVESVETRVGPIKRAYGLKQKLPFYGKRGLMSEIATKEAEALEASYETVRQEVVRRVKIAYYDLFYLSKLIDITDEEKEILKRFEQTATIKYETGKGSQQNILKVQVEMNRLEDRRLTLLNRKKTSEARLNVLLDRTSDHPVKKPVQPEFRDFFYIKQQLIRLARDHRPELKMGDAWIEKSDRALILAKKDYYPDLTIGANYIEIDKGPLMFSDNGQDAFNVVFSINVPLWSNKLSSQVGSATKMVTAQKSVYKSILNRTLFEIEDNLFKIETARETSNLYQNVLIPRAEQSLKSAEVGYITGVVNFLDLLDAERVLLKIQFDYWKSYTDYVKGIADMERAVGIELPEYLPTAGSPEVREE